MQIINSDKEKKEEIKMKPEMLNLLGCNKDNFQQLLKSMDYKVIEKNNDILFRYVPKKVIKNKNEKNLKESPFKILKNLNLN